MIEPIFGAKEGTRMQDFVLKYRKKSGGRDPRTPAIEGDTLMFASTSMPTCQMLVPPPLLLLGWLRLCRQVNSALFFKLMLFSPCRFSTVVCPRCAPDIGGGHNANWGGTLKKFPALCAVVCAPPNFKTVSAPMDMTMRTHVTDIVRACFLP